MSRMQFEAKCRAALFWTIALVIVGEYTCREAPLESPEWLIAGIVLACLGVFFGRMYLSTAFTAVSNVVDAEKLSSALSRLGLVSLVGLVFALVLGWRAQGELLFNASLAGGELAFGLFMLWSEFWFRRLLGEESAGSATKR